MKLELNYFRNILIALVLSILDVPLFCSCEKDDSEVSTASGELMYDEFLGYHYREISADFATENKQWTVYMRVRQDDANLPWADGFDNKVYYDKEGEPHLYYWRTDFWFMDFYSRRTDESNEGSYNTYGSMYEMCLWEFKANTQHSRNTTLTPGLVVPTDDDKYEFSSMSLKYMANFKSSYFKYESGTAEVLSMDGDKIKLEMKNLKWNDGEKTCTFNGILEFRMKMK